MRHTLWYGGDTARNWWGDRSDGTLETTADATFPSELDGDMVVKQFSRLVINAGHTVTVAQRCKGLVVYVNGDCIINGTLSMTARGANASADDAGEYLYTYPEVATANIFGGSVFYGITTALPHPYLNGSYIELRNVVSNERCVLQVYDTLPPNEFFARVVGTGTMPTDLSNCVTRAITTPGLRFRRFTDTGAASHNSPPEQALNGAGDALIASERNQKTIFNDGTIFTIDREAGAPGNSTGAYQGSGGGSGALGTAWSGGTGGGTTGLAPSPNPQPYAGAPGGSGQSNGGSGGFGNQQFLSAGGAGNPGGLGFGVGAAGTDGTGGTIILFVRGTLTIGAAGRIESRGSLGGRIPGLSNPFPPPFDQLWGGSSGGGPIMVLYAGELQNDGIIASGDAINTPRFYGNPGLTIIDRIAV
jgi:hypothetical protein